MEKNSKREFLPIGDRRKVSYMVQQTLEELGGIDYLKQLAHADPKAFASLLKGCIPASFDLPEDTGLSVQIVRFGSGETETLKKVEPVTIETNRIPRSIEDLL